MRSDTYTAKRRSHSTYGYSNSSYRTSGGFSAGASSFSRNRNTVKHIGKTFGPISMVVIIGIQLVGIGLLYLSQGTKATSYDYELSSIQTQIEDLEAERDDLAVEKARLQSIARSEQSTVAAAMEDAVSAATIGE